MIRPTTTCSPFSSTFRPPCRAVIDKILTGIEPRIDDARSFALANRVLLLKSATGIPVDLALGALPFEESATKRAKNILIADIPLRLCTAEDLVVMKAFANRPRDWSDVEGILIRQKGKLDIAYVLKQLSVIAPAKPDEDIIGKLEALLQAGPAPRNPASRVRPRRRR